MGHMQCGMPVLHHMALRGDTGDTVDTHSWEGWPWMEIKIAVMGAVGDWE